MINKYIAYIALFVAYYATMLAFSGVSFAEVIDGLRHLGGF